MAPPTKTIIHLLLVHNKIQDVITSSLKPFDVSIQQFNVLRILRGQKGVPVNMATINDRMVTKMSNTTRLVDKLMAKGMVLRKVCPDNRRKVQITITTLGREKLALMDEVVLSAEKQLLQNLSERDMEQLNNLLDKF
ncbi:MAG: MarR family winged helix-turn-helix transcriptional regulator [Flavobacteriaceae bacterium]